MRLHRVTRPYARALVALAVMLPMLAVSTPARAAVVPLGTAWSVPAGAVFPTKVTQPVTTSSLLDTSLLAPPGNTALPSAVTIDFPVGHTFAHADSNAGVPVSPMGGSDPVPGDLVATFTAFGHFGLFGCGAPATVTLPAFWDEAWALAPVADQVAELSIGPTSIGFLYARITRTGVGPYTYHLTAGIPIALLACPGSELKLTTKMFDYSRRVLAASPFTVSMPSSRIFQTNSAAVGPQSTTLTYASGPDTYTGAATYPTDLTALTDVTAPTAAFTGIPIDTIVSGAVTVTAADDSAVVAAVEFGMDTVAGLGKSLGSTFVKTFPGPYTLDSTLLPDGAHTLYARAVDGSNNNVNAATAAVIFDNVLPTVAFTGPANLTDPVVATFNEPDMTGIDASSFLLSNDTTAASVPGTIACKNASGATVGCGSGSVKTATYTPTSPLIPGEDYTAAMNPIGDETIEDAAANVLGGTTASFRGLLQNQENSPAARYAWRKVGTPAAYGGSFTYDHLSGASATYKFTGTGIKWYTNRGPSYGTAKVYIDGVLNRTSNLYRAANQYRYAVSIGGLAAGDHVLKIVATGAKGAAAGTDSRVAVDAFWVGGVITASPVVTYGWRAAASASASGGKYVMSDVAGSAVGFTFHGVRFDWYTVRGPKMGIAQLFIDGVLRATYNNYSATTGFGLRRRIIGLADAVHTAKIVVTGTKSAASGGTNVVVDRFAVL